MTDSGTVRARTVVIATGARYRRLAIPNLATLEGRGVSYWASPVEAKLCEGEEVALVGGGNSAGQAVVWFPAHDLRFKPPHNVRLWHFSDIPPAPTNVPLSGVKRT